MFSLFLGNHIVTKTEFEHEWSEVLFLGGPPEADSLFLQADENHDGVLTNADLPDIFAYFDMNGSNNKILNIYSLVFIFLFSP